jgi:hypothetical protein
VTSQTSIRPSRVLLNLAVVMLAIGLFIALYLFHNSLLLSLVERNCQGYSPTYDGVHLYHDKNFPGYCEMYFSSLEEKALIMAGLATVAIGLVVTAIAVHFKPMRHGRSRRVALEASAAALCLALIPAAFWALPLI